MRAPFEKRKTFASSPVLLRTSGHPFVASPPPRSQALCHLTNQTVPKYFHCLCSIESVWLCFKSCLTVSDNGCRHEGNIQRGLHRHPGQISESHQKTATQQARRRNRKEKEEKEDAES